MATAVSIAIRRQDAQARIQAASVKLAKAHGIEPGDLAPTSKQPDIEAALVLEAVAAFLEQLAAAKHEPVAPTKPTPEHVKRQVKV